jgi:hypothetical protein
MNESVNGAGSAGAQVDLDWPEMEQLQDAEGGSAGQSGAGNARGGANGRDGAAGSAYLTDEEILGMEPTGSERRPAVNEQDAARPGESPRRDSGRPDATRRDLKDDVKDGTPAARAGEASDVAAMPVWMQTLAGDPQHGPEAQQLWRDHQEFRQAFSSPQEAREIKELFPGGVQDARVLRQASQAVDQLDAAIYSGDARAQSEVVTELARTNPAAFRSLFAEAAKVLAGLGGAGVPAGASKSGVADGVREDSAAGRESAARNDNANAAAAANLNAAESTASGAAPRFDPAAYASFERGTNEVVARDVRSAVGDTLARVLPEGVAEGAARRIGDDIFNEVHRTMAADRNLSEQVGAVLRSRQFGMAEQQQVAALLAGRARQLVPGVARRVIGEWTSSVLGTARNKAARQAVAASRVDIGAQGGSRESVPLRAMTAREVNYASMSDDEILGM